MESTKTVSTRLSPSEEREVVSLAKKFQLNKAEFLRKILLNGLEEAKEEYGVDLYRKRKVSLGKAAELSGKSLWEMLDALRVHNVHLSYDVAELEKDLETVNRLNR